MPSNRISKVLHPLFEPRPRLTLYADLTEGINASDPFTPVKALRHLKHRKHQERLFRLDKDARLRSGARGMQARKALTAFEKVVAESNEL